MDKGKIVAQGSPEQLKASIGADVVTVRVPDNDGVAQRAADAVRSVPGLEDVRIVEDTIIVYVRDGKSAVAPVVLALEKGNVPVEEISLARPSLDDVFLQTTGRHLEEEGRGT